MGKVNKPNLFRNIMIAILIFACGFYLLEREIKINEMEKELEEISDLNDNLESINEELETQLDIIKEMQNNN